MNYSVRKNVIYMMMAFYKPRHLTDCFLGEISLLYSVIPLIVFTAVYEILYVVDYVLKEPEFVHIITQIFEIPDICYNFYQIFLFPVVHIADFCVFGGVVYAGSTLLQVKVDTKKVLLFFMFIFNTIGLVSAAADALSFVWESEILMYVHPLTGIIFFGYLVKFTEKQAKTGIWKPLILSLVGLIGALGFRILFLG